jgi:hypothetical protein
VIILLHGAADVVRHVIARAAARGNLRSPTTGDCFVVSLLAMTIPTARLTPRVNECFHVGIQISVRQDDLEMSTMI